MATRLGTLTVAVLFLVLVSAAWVETDKYRIASLILVLWGIAIYVRADFRPSIGWMGFACIAWALMVGARYAAIYLDGKTHSLGTSEGIYMLPAFYITVGYMMFLYRRILPAVTVAFILISLVALAASIDYANLLNGLPHPFLYMNNTIHSSVAAGLIIFAAINFAAYHGRSNPDRMKRWLFEAVAYLTIVLCLIGLYGAKSKGVWVAIAFALGMQMLLSLRITRRSAPLAKGGLLLVAFAAFVLIFAASNWATIGPSFDSIKAIFIRALETGHPLTAMREALASGSVPVTTEQRLMLWHNAIQVWAENPLFGNGIAWLDVYGDTYYKEISYDIVHNGYLEVAMRYGFFGLGFYAVLYGWSVAMARSALRQGLIAAEAYRFHLVSLVFFLGTIMTNSNNRLAIGETFMMTAAAFGFYCFYLRQNQVRNAAA